MTHEIIRMLSPVTDEEQEILQGGQVRQERYSNPEAFVIDSRRMVRMGKLIDIRAHTRFTPFPKHRHNYIEIIYMVQGCTEHTVGEQDRFTLRQGELLFLNQNAWHSIEAAGQDDLAVNLIVLPEFFDAVFSLLDQPGDVKYFLEEALTGKKRPGSLHFACGDNIRVQNLMENLLLSLLRNEESHERINQVTMGLLLLELMNCPELLSLPTDRQETDTRLYIRILQYIEENYRTAALADFSDHEQISIYHASRLVKARSGHSFKELLQNRRLSRAAQLLSHTTLSVNDIIEAVGYNNSSYFFHIFNESYGMTPSQYRIVTSEDQGIRQSQTVKAVDGDTVPE